MPLTRIEVRKSWAPEQVQAIMSAVELAQKSALMLPENDRQIRFVEHRPEHCRVMSDHTENYTLVEVTLFSGRSLDTKRALYQAIVRNLGEVGIAPHDVFIVLLEVPRENWGIKGGIPASEVALGFKVDI